MEAQIEKAIKLRKQANFKILTRLAQIIECSPHLRFQQILSNYKVCELGKDKFYEESIETLRNLEGEAAKDKAAEKARLTELLAKKQSEKMESMSEDEIRQRLAELG